MQFFSFCQTQTDTVVARKRAGTGQDKVADTGKPIMVLGRAPMAMARRVIYETARHQRCTRIESVFETRRKDRWQLP